MIRLGLIVLCVTLYSLDQSTGAVFVSNLDASCLKCICVASTDCDESYGCSEQGFCGPLFISHKYWEEAGRLAPAGDFFASAGRLDPHNACARDLTCASRVVINYMAKHAKDCNEDGVTDCDDFARVHFYGEARCSNPIFNTSYYNRYLSCRPAKSPISL